MKLLPITDCIECPHFDEGGGHCHYADRKFTEFELFDKDNIPGWCPLESAPAKP